MRQEMMGFGDAVASAGPYANNLHLDPDRKPHQHLITQFFTGRMLFLTPNQQCQSTEGSEMKTRCAYISNANILLTSAVGTDPCFFTVKSLHSSICYFSNASLATFTSYYCNNNNNKNSNDNTSNGNNLFETVHCGSPQK